MGDEQEARTDDDHDKLGEIDWVIDSLPDPVDLFGEDFQFFLGDDNDSHLLNELEQMLLNDGEDDDYGGVVVDALDDKYSEFGIVLNAESPTQETSSEEEKGEKMRSDVSDDQIGVLNVESPDLEMKSQEKKRKIDDPIDDDADPVSKKVKRQLRNRHSAHQSRERKKVYVRDLEMKSRYLETECRRLENLLRHYLAENQSLQLHLQHRRNDEASGVVMGQKQESAVLSLESLLLGSLLWLMNIVCIFLVTGLLPGANPKLVMENTVSARGSEEQGKVGPRGNDTLGSGLRLGKVMLSRSCRGTRKKMKVGSFFGFSWLRSI